jgi:hypothetical protein
MVMASEPDQQHVTCRHRAAHRRPDHHADAVSQREDALRKPGFGRVEFQALGDKGEHRSKGVPVCCEKYLAEDGEHEHPVLPAGDPPAIVLRNCRPIGRQHGHHQSFCPFPLHIEEISPGVLGPAVAEN